MAETPKPSQQQSLWERSKPPEGEKGVLGPIDTLNRVSYTFSKPLFMASGVATLMGVPYAGIALVGTGLWAGGDKLAIESSKWAKRKVSGDMKPGEEVNLPKSKRNLALAA